ncbi:MAG: PDZ domain-containing protein [bacterium]
MSLRYLSLVLSVIASMSIQADPKTAHRPTPFLGIAMKAIEVQVSKDSSKQQAIKINVVLQNTAAKAAGLKAGDIILSYDGNNFQDCTPNQQLQQFKKHLTKVKQIGEELSLKVLRAHTELSYQQIPVTDAQLDLMAEKMPLNQYLPLKFFKKGEVLNYRITLRQKRFERLTPPSSNKELFPQLSQNSELEAVCKDALKQVDKWTQYQQVKSLIKKTEYWDDGIRVPLLRYIKQDPIAGADQVLTHMMQQHRQNTAQQLRHYFQYLQSVPLVSKQEMNIPPATLLGFKQGLEKAFKQAEAAFNPLNSEERQTIQESLSFLNTELVEHYALSALGEPNTFDKSERLVDLVRKVDLPSLYQASDTLAFLQDKRWLKAFKKHLKNTVGQRRPSKNGILRQEKTAFGDIIIGNESDQVYTKSVAVIIDLGGNDQYLTHASPGQSQIILDFDGDDSYIATEPLAQGAACLGVSILIDVKGNDTYISKVWGQGIGIFGLGLVIDQQGNDTYIGQQLCQGIGFAGVGGIIDQKGQDQYQIQGFGQGLGLPRGLGFIDDRKGHDRYRALGGFKSSYGTDNVFKGAAQGLGIGFREMASGGIGLLLDRQGKDSFLAGNFSLGTGYAYGLGVLLNLGNEDDEYQASRYSMATAAHQAVGLFYDEGGNDRYRGSQGVKISAAWDQSVTMFIDKDGHDQYQTPDQTFSIAAADHSSFALFIDENGQNKIDQAKKTGQSSNTYHQGQSLAIWMRDLSEKTPPKEPEQTRPSFVGNTLLLINKK